MVEDRVRLVRRDYCMNPRLDKMRVQQGKRPLETDGENEAAIKKLSKNKAVFVDTSLSLGGILMSAFEESDDDEQHEGDDAGDNNADSSPLIDAIGRDPSISCLLRVSRADYGALACLNSGFRSLIRSGELYGLRRLNGRVEHWVYFSCQLLEWEAFDPSRRRWMRLPNMDPNGCFVFSDKESLAVGTELLVFGRDLTDHVIYRYSLMTNTWSTGVNMNAPRCLFGSGSLGVIAIVAGGCDSCGTILNSAELYNSELGVWNHLPNMNTPRKMCSGVVMDEKFYVIGGIGGDEGKLLTCGEEFNVETGTWTVIPNMSPVHMDPNMENNPSVAADAPPLVAVVNNQLYAADYSKMELKKFDKVKKEWRAIGSLPERADSMNGWGLAFKACGDKLIVIGGPRMVGEGYIEVNSWVPTEGRPEWVLLGRKRSGSFVYNCAVMGC